MFRIDSPGATNENRFTEGDPNTGTPATVVSADFMNAVQEEIGGVVEGANIELDKSNNKQMLAAIKALVKSEMASLYMPVGTIYGNDTDSRNPASIFGFGVWAPIKSRSLVGVDGSDPDFDAAGKEGGSKTHSHTTQSAGAHIHSIQSAGSHSHSVPYDNWSSFASAPSPSFAPPAGNLLVGSGNVEFDETLESVRAANSDNNTGSAGSHTHTVNSSGDHSHTVNSSSNLSPYRAVYLWRRTA